MHLKTLEITFPRVCFKISGGRIPLDPSISPAATFSGC